ncbi:MAG: bacillithiol biosynthesis cysteine-adding enzyme BshC [Acidobacteria bacterium]|nr:bacillithiol biosynthesis cysteine-adding enzyme BshC [Acidobacteriota bacterium]MCA1641716.1 bacillithiol biosynthesis cysteine-adding enzyme BshC [Acidobacteriota bacterium]
MSTTEAACYSTPEEAGLRVESLPFERVPQQSRLFLDYLRDAVALKKFYPSAVRFHHELSARAAEVLAAHRADRDALCDALEESNRGWGAGGETLANVARLRSGDCVAVVSGQQVGLFTGPLYTIYKALSAVKLAGCLSQRGTPAVPVFWMATEDHDWEEVRAAELTACDGRLAVAELPAAAHTEGAPVGSVLIDDSIEETIKRLVDVLPTTEFSDDLERTVRAAYAPGRTYGEAFARMLTALIGRHGLVLLDPLDARLKRLAAPLYSEAARRAPEIAAAVEARSRELAEAGYHAQVHASADAFPLFLHADGARRVALARSGDGRYCAKDARDGTGYTADELAEWALREPENFSPNVTLRAVVQDYLLPTVAYYGGAAEIAYFAQTAEVYRVLSRPATPILHRASLTLVERRTGRTLERYDLKLEDFFAGLDSVVARVVEEHLGAEQARAFDLSEQKIKNALSELGERLRGFDPTLADALSHGGEKIEYQLAGLRTRFHRAQMARDRAAHRQLERAAALLYPEKALQERHLNITSLVARHGVYCLDWIFSAIDIGSSDHQIVYL